MVHTEHITKEYGAAQVKYAKTIVRSDAAMAELDREFYLDHGYSARDDKELLTYAGERS